MSKLILPADYQQPIIITWDKLQRTLWPYIYGYSWARDTLHDLWKVCIPTPTSVVGSANEERILHPSQFAKWWGEVCQRQGLTLPAEKVFRETPSAQVRG